MGSATSVIQAKHRTESFAEYSVGESVNSTATVVWFLPAILLNGPPAPVPELVKDSAYHRSYLPQTVSNELFALLQRQVNLKSPASNSAPSAEHNLVAKHFGCRRDADTVIAFDRWGSNYESWSKVEVAPQPLKDLRARLQTSHNLSPNTLNAIAVTCYHNGAEAYEAAHRITTTALQVGSSVFCVFLGSERDFVLCSNSDHGKCNKTDMTVYKEWNARHGDLFILGPKSNTAFCHALLKNPAQKGLHICIVLRTVDKSFVDYTVLPKPATYASGVVKYFAVECITATGFDDPGTREHLSNLISAREARVRKGRQGAVAGNDKAMVHAAQQAVLDSSKRV
jgi:alkylated DNA repair dioxygenase AlkB